MVTTKCRCGNSSFKLTLKEPTNANFVLNFVHCTKCGIAVGVLDNMNIGAMLLQQNAAIKKIADHLGVPVGLP